MPRYPLLFLALVAGCSGDDPATSKLKAGQVVVLVGTEATYLHDEPTMPRVDPGSRMTVADDPGDWVEPPEIMERRIASESKDEAERSRRDGPLRAKAGEMLSGLRRVRVMVDTGQSAGKSGSIPRNDVRPIQ